MTGRSRDRVKRASGPLSCRMLNRRSSARQTSVGTVPSPPDGQTLCSPRTLRTSWPALYRAGKTHQQNVIRSSRPAYSRAIRNRDAQHLRGYGCRPGIRTAVGAYDQRFRGGKAAGPYQCIRQPSSDWKRCGELPEVPGNLAKSNLHRHHLMRPGVNESHSPQRHEASHDVPLMHCRRQCLHIVLKRH